MHVQRQNFALLGIAYKRIARRRTGAVTLGIPAERVFEVYSRFRRVRAALGNKFYPADVVKTFAAVKPVQNHRAVAFAQIHFELVKQSLVVRFFAHTQTFKPILCIMRRIARRKLYFIIHVVKVNIQSFRVPNVHI